jgi:nucleoside-diphosphate-sugar epimerase
MKIQEIESMPHLYLDMDGVQADFFGRWAEIEKVKHYKDITDSEEAIVRLAKSGPENVYHFFRDLDPLPGGQVIIRWLQQNKIPFTVRYPQALRPWQHVLEVVYGYILLAINLYNKKFLHGHAFNFGPNSLKNYSVISVVKLMKSSWKNVSWDTLKKNKKTFKESKLLKLNSRKANTLLKWNSVLGFEETINLVTEWYKNFYTNSSKANHLTFDQIKKYQKLIEKKF